MWFRLALKMGRTVNELQRAMTSAEFGEWIAFYSLEPFGDRVEDLRTGIVSSVIANVNRGPNVPAFAPIDFVPWAQEKEKPSGPPPAEAVAALFGVNLAEAKKHGKKFILRREPGRGFRPVEECGERSK
ncbi:DUF4035 domain-containing protein [Ralstonia solanacearum]|nr:DUF4035 domain-containing protein [Ralstonia solanacearum]QKL77335.1 DUF4035 domain-containing protein [Ralstonia solanacearum]QKL82541.1 DUF4035 domain-containing protein [Ralstonia solanacearum]QKL87751.1 DUF4035 domain-containing protein [Ralstonia solanacearum]QKM03118.1 DUF4035 domain-containing protein [Ralstonia solanacearum]